MEEGCDRVHVGDKTYVISLRELAKIEGLKDVIEDVEEDGGVAWGAHIVVGDGSLE